MDLISTVSTKAKAVVQAVDVKRLKQGGERRGTRLWRSGTVGRREGLGKMTSGRRLE